MKDGAPVQYVDVLLASADEINNELSDALAPYHVQTALAEAKFIAGTLERSVKGDALLGRQVNVGDQHGPSRRLLLFAELILRPSKEFPASQLFSR